MGQYKRGGMFSADRLVLGEKSPEDAMADLEEELASIENEGQ